MPNQHTPKRPTARPNPLAIRLRPEEHEECKNEAKRRGMTIADVIRERCAWDREDGRPNEPWSNQREKTDGKEGSK
jgi:hypothetical protein